MENVEIECARYLVKMQMRAYKHMLYIFAVNRELHKKTTPELALYIIKFLTHVTPVRVDQGKGGIQGDLKRKNL